MNYRIRVVHCTGFCPIESRPIPGRNWEYRFFVDVEGNLDDAAVQNALRGVKEESAFMRVLGNFEA